MAYTLTALLLPASCVGALPVGVTATLLTPQVALVPLDELERADAVDAEPGDVIDPPRENWAINRALAALGVPGGDALDRFAAVDLGRHRSTIGWLRRDPIGETSIDPA